MPYFSCFKVLDFDLCACVGGAVIDHESNIKKQVIWEWSQMGLARGRGREWGKEDWNRGMPEDFNHGDDSALDSNLKVDRAKVKSKGMERWRSSEEHLLIVQKTRVQAPVPMAAHCSLKLSAPGNLVPSLVLHRHCTRMNVPTSPSYIYIYS